MTARILVVLALCACIVAPARAATIDPELLDAFAAHGPGSQLRVMVLFEDTVDLARLQADVSGLAPLERRKQVVQTLKAHAAATQAGMRAMIEASIGREKASRVRTLWTVNALALTADRALVETMAAAQPRARIVFDKRYDMISAVTAPPTRPAGEGTADASKVDTIAWNVDWIHAPEVWNTLGYTGNGIVVAHVDGGVNQSHPDLVNRLWVNPGEIPGNQIDDDGNGYVDDVHGYDFADDDADPQDDAPSPNGGHGTHTAGTVAGDGTGGTYTGVAPGAQLMLCKVFPSSGDNASFAEIWAAHQYAMENGARVITESLGAAGPDIPESLMRSERLDGDAIRAAGLVLFAAAGNDHNVYDPPLEVGLPARVPAPWNSIPSLYTSLSGVVAVGGTGYKQNTIYDSSAQGPVDWSGISPWNDWPSLIKPDIAAPGVGVNSTVRTGGYSGDSWVGTSMSCPHIAGVAALMLEKNPALPPEKIDEILETTALDLGDPGKDDVFGSGLVDALAAVEATPTTGLPHLIQSGVTILDTGGDRVIDPGEDFELAIDLTNNGLVDATTVSATLSVVANPFVSVTDAQGAWATIPSGGGKQSNTGDTFGLTADAAATQGFEFTIVVAIDADGGYHKEIDSRLVVGRLDFADHDVGAVILTVTDQGSLGYMGDDQIQGSGFGPARGSSALFIGSFWAGNDLSYICNHDYSGTGTAPERFEWRVVTNPDGRMEKLGPGKSDQDFRATYNDAGAGTSAKGVQVTQRSFAWADEGYDQFVMILYTVTNTGGTALADWHAGVFCDWDVGSDPFTDRGDTDFARQVSYIYGNRGRYAGVAYLGTDRVANLTMIDNSTYVGPTFSIPDGAKVGFLKGKKSTFRVPQTTAPGDWSALTSVGPFDLAPGATVHVPFAVVYGTSLEEFQANVDRAQERWNDAGIVAIAPPPPGDVPAPIEHRLALAQNRPNPFNPSTTIFFSTERTGLVKLAVYDLAGRLVRTLVDREFEPGSWSATWDGSDDRGRVMPSGLYLYRLETANRVLSRKMMLVK